MTISIGNYAQKVLTFQNIHRETRIHCTQSLIQNEFKVERITVPDYRKCIKDVGC